MRKSLMLIAGLSTMVLSPAAIPSVALAQSGPLSAVLNCTAAGNKQETGALIGAAVGGLLGNQISDDNKTLGTALGVAIGAAAGSYIGCRMQKDDQAKAEAAARVALDTGSNQVWTNSQTGASGSTNVIQVANTSGTASTGTSLSQLRLAAGVTPVSVSAFSGLYYAPGAANVRSGPSTSSSVLGKLSAQQKVQVLAKVASQPWYLIGKDGIGMGYVSSTVVKPVPATVSGSTVTQASASNCKVIEQTYTPSGQPVTVERYNACKDATGQWQLTRI